MFSQFIPICSDNGTGISYFGGMALKKLPIITAPYKTQILAIGSFGNRELKLTG